MKVKRIVFLLYITGLCLMFVYWYHGSGSLFSRQNTTAARKLKAILPKTTLPESSKSAKQIPRTTERKIKSIWKKSTLPEKSTSTKQIPWTTDNLKPQVLKSAKFEPGNQCAVNLSWPNGRDEWQILDNNITFVYSAFAVPLENQVKIMGIHRIRIRPKRHYVCWFYNDTQNVSQLQTNGTISLLHDHHGRSYGSMMVTCPLKDNYNWNAVAVSISVNDTPLNYMVLHYPEKQIKRNFTICLSVMHSKYSKVLELIETFEFDKALGANHFVLYHRSSAKQSNVVLNHYIKSGELTLLNYTLPIPPKGIHYFGQIAAVNDCVYRSRGISRYVLVVDIDEILIPYQFNNWMSMMDNLTASNPNASAFMFRNTFFDTSMPDDIRRFRLSDKATRYKLKKFLKVWREDFIFGYCNRCKTLVMPEWIDKMAIHRTERIKGDHTPLRVNKSVALLHHYRRYGSSQARVFNAQTRKYSGIVVGRVIKTYEKLKPCVPDL